MFIQHLMQIHVVVHFFRAQVTVPRRIANTTQIGVPPINPINDTSMSKAGQLLMDL